MKKEKEKKRKSSSVFGGAGWGGVYSLMFQTKEWVTNKMFDTDFAVQVCMTKNSMGLHEENKGIVIDAGTSD